MKLLAFIALSAVAFAQVQVSTTATQVILTYSAPDTNACTLDVRKSGAASVVHDVDATLFSGANSDSRSVITGSTARKIVIGKRDAELASDGNWYSRALQAATLHAYTITCTSPTTYTGTFTTSNIPLGQSYNDPLPVDSAHPGNYAWPTINWNSRAQTIVDPRTGVLLAKLDSGRDSYFLVDFTSTHAFASATGTNWASPSNALADDSSSATYSAATQDQLFLELGASFGNDDNHGPSGYSANNLNVTFNAWCPGCSGASNADSSIQYCLTENASTCATDWISAVLAFCSSGCTTGNRFSLFSGTPLEQLGDWFPGESGTNSGVGVPELAKRTGTVNRTGATVVLTGGSTFCLCWNGGKITINGTAYGIATVNSDQSITLSGSPTGTDTGVAYTASNAGLLIRKQTTGTQQISIQSVTYSYEVGDPPALEAGGDEDALGNCAPVMVAGPGGEMGYHCQISQVLYWIGATSLAHNRIGKADPPFNSGPPSYPSGGVCSNNSSFWDATDPNTLWCAVLASNGHYLVLKMTYTGSNADIGPLQEIQAMVACGSSPCWTVTNETTTGNELDSQIAPFVGSAWNNFNIAQLAVIGKTASNNSLMILMRNSGANNDTLAWLCKYNLTTLAVDACANTWSTWPLRWAGSHGPLDMRNASWADIEAHTFPGSFTPGTNENAGSGPYYSVITSGAVSSSGSACPTQPVGSPIPPTQWPTGNNCLTITLDGEPGDPSPAFYNTGTVTTLGTSVTGSGTAWTSAMSGGQMLIASTYYTFTFVSATSGTLSGSPGASGASYKLFLESVNSGKTGNVGFAYLQDLAVRDVGCIAPGGSNCVGLYPGSSGTEYFRVIAKSGSGPGTTLTLQRGWTGVGGTPGNFIAQASSSWFVTQPSSFQFGPVYPGAQNRVIWDFIHDPHGLNASGNTIVANPNDPGCCHATFANVSVDLSYVCPTRDGDNSWCHASSYAAPPAILTAAAPYVTSMNPLFHGLAGWGSPNPVDTHPSHPQTTAPEQENGWIAEARPLLGDDVGSAGGTGLTGSSSSPGTNTTGSLYKFTAAQTSRLRPHTFPTIAACGPNPLLDVSGASSAIGGTSGDNYKYCIANVANECVSGSSAGYLYVNCPYVSSAYCVYQGVGGSDPERRDICVADMGAYTLSATQSSIRQPDPDGSNGRRITHAFSRYHYQYQFWNVKSTQDGHLAFIWSDYLGGLKNTVLIAKLPPFPAGDSVNRGDYIPVPVKIYAGSIAGASTAVVQFGYDTSYHCTSRQETCVAGSAGTVQWASESPTGVACTTSCTVTVPAISQRILYYRWQVLNSGGSVLQSGPVQVIAIL